MNIQNYSSPLLRGSSAISIEEKYKKRKEEQKLQLLQLLQQQNSIKEQEQRMKDLEIKVVEKDQFIYQIEREYKNKIEDMKKDLENKQYDNNEQKQKIQQIEEKLKELTKNQEDNQKITTEMKINQLKQDTEKLKEKMKDQEIKSWVKDTMEIYKLKDDQERLQRQQYYIQIQNQNENMWQVRNDDTGLFQPHRRFRPITFNDSSFKYQIKVLNDQNVNIEIPEVECNYQFKEFMRQIFDRYNLNPNLVQKAIMCNTGVCYDRAQWDNTLFELFGRSYQIYQEIRLAQ